MLLRVILLGLLFASSLFAQAKVGTVTASFVELSSSVRANGMGETGVAIVDRQSFFYNPATLGLTQDYTTTLSFYPVPTDFGYTLEYSSASLVGHVLGSSGPIALNAAVQRSSLSGQSTERTYDQGTYGGTGRTFRNENYFYGLTVGASYSGAVQFGAGATVRRIEQEYNSFEVGATSFDFGGLVRLPFVGGPEGVETAAGPLSASFSAGCSFSHYGQDVTLSSSSYPLPRTRRIGIAFDARLRKYSAVLALEDQTQLIYSESILKYGLQLGYADAVWARIGYIDGKSSSRSRATYGGSVSVRGLITTLTGSGRAAGNGGFFKRLDLIGSFATYGADEGAFWNGIDFFMLELVI